MLNEKLEWTEHPLLYVRGKSFMFLHEYKREAARHLTGHWAAWGISITRFNDICIDLHLLRGDHLCGLLYFYFFPWYAKEIYGWQQGKKSLEQNVEWRFKQNKSIFIRQGSQGVGRRDQSTKVRVGGMEEYQRRVSRFKLQYSGWFHSTDISECQPLMYCTPCDLQSSHV